MFVLKRAKEEGKEITRMFLKRYTCAVCSKKFYTLKSVCSVIKERDDSCIEWMLVTLCKRCGSEIKKDINRIINFNDDKYKKINNPFYHHRNFC